MENKDNYLMIGASRVKIEIPDNFFPYKSFRGRLLIGMHDDIHVRCIIVANRKTSALILSVETGDMGDIDMWLEKISKASGVPASNILITASHTHEAPHISDSWNQDVVDVEKTAQFGQCAEEAIMEAVKTAKGNMRPGRIGYGTGQCDINVNADFKYKGNYVRAPNPHGLSDKTVAVMKFEDLNGEVIAYLYNYAVHGIVMFLLGKERGMLLGGDLPGETSRYIEKRHDGKVVALWCMGAAGDQFPRYIRNRMIFDSQGNSQMLNAGEEGGFLLVQVQAESLADEVLLVANNISETSPRAVIKGVHKKITVPGQKKLEDPGVTFDDYKTDSFKFEDANPVEMHLSLLIIDHITFMGIPGELVCSIGMLLKNTLPYRNVVVVTQCNGSVSYISDEKGYEERTFEATASHIKRGYAEKALVNGALDMVEELEGNK